MFASDSLSMPSKAILVLWPARKPSVALIGIRMKRPMTEQKPKSLMLQRRQEGMVS